MSIAAAHEISKSRPPSLKINFYTIKLFIECFIESSKHRASAAFIARVSVDHNSLKKPNYSIKFVVPFGDVDMMGHVNNVRYLGYFENARVEHLQSLVGPWKLAEQSFILAHAEIDYKSPSEYRDELSVGVRVASVGNSSWVYHYEVTNVKEKRLVAIGKTVQVAYDYAKGRPMQIPEAFKKKLIEEMKSSEE
jgi:acyl-CoA thioester hydrolase